MSDTLWDGIERRARERRDTDADHPVDVQIKLARGDISDLVDAIKAMRDYFEGERIARDERRRRAQERREKVYVALMISGATGGIMAVWQMAKDWLKTFFRS